MSTNQIPLISIRLMQQSSTSCRQLIKHNFEQMSGQQRRLEILAHKARCGQIGIYADNVKFLEHLHAQK